jgi:pimeloyl-ACP methyl ester carboxylesterase
VATDGGDDRLRSAPRSRASRAPVLALFGADDPITPVEESVAVFREAVWRDLLQVEVFAAAGHRLETGDPPALADGYLETLARFVLRAVFLRTIVRPATGPPR